MLVLLSGADAAIPVRRVPAAGAAACPASFIDLGRLILDHHRHRPVAVVGMGRQHRRTPSLRSASRRSSSALRSRTRSARSSPACCCFRAAVQDRRLPRHQVRQRPCGRGELARGAHRYRNGIQIIPNAALAETSFINPQPDHRAVLQGEGDVQFRRRRPPGLVKSTLLTVADAAPAKLADAKAFGDAVGSMPSIPGWSASG